MPELGSPKFHKYVSWFAVPSAIVVRSVNCADATGKQVLDTEKFGTGNGFTFIDFENTELLQPSLVVTVNVTV